MRIKIITSAGGLLFGVAGLVCAQTTLNNFPSRDVGWAQLTGGSSNPNLVEGREFDAPQAVAIDTSVTPPVLYVSDFANNRVLAWNNALSFNPGQSADFVIGQKDLFSTSQLGPGTNVSTGLNHPTGLAVDKNGNLYILDTGNNRILRFPTPYSQPGQPLPDLVIGQIGLSCAACAQANSGGISAKTIAVFSGSIYVAGIAFDANGNLWFTDAANNRVLRYPASVLGPNASNGPAADLVLGQVDFVSNKAPAGNAASAQSTGTMYQPLGLTFDPTGRLYVADSFDRVLVFAANLQPPVSNGTPALRIMGIAAANPRTPPPAINQVTFGAIQGVFMIGNNPGVVDAGYHRLLLFDPFEQWPTDNTSPPAKATTGPVGQFGYNAGSANRGNAEPAANSLNQPSFAVASGTELFVVDSGNNRVLVFPQNALGQNSSAVRLLGQTDYPFRAPNLIEGREFNFVPGNGNGDGGVLIDLVSSVPHLYVADTYNNRVLGFKDARTVRPGTSADIVIGQVDFQRSIVNYPTNDPTKPNSQGLNSPVGLALDANGNLFVADAGNGRVLRFPQPFNQQQNSYEAADLVLGQSSFGAQITDPTQRTMRSPYGLANTSNGGLLVSDFTLNRVLLFDGPESGFTNGMNATKVFGQPDFQTITAAPLTDTNLMNGPRHIATDSDDRLYVADEKNNRVMIFDQVSLINSNARAGTILTGPGNNNFGSPRGIWVSKITGEIWVSEANVGRLSRFPDFNNLLGNQNQSNFQIAANAAIALTQDSFGDLYTAEVVNRIAIYFPPVSGVNAANSLPNRAVAPGTIVTLYRQGSIFTTDKAVTGSPTWPTSLADTQVLVNGSPAPIDYVDQNQLNFMVPMNAPTSGTVEVQVVRQSTGQVLGVGLLPMAPASPGLFTLNGLGTGQLAAINQDGTINGPSQPINRGQIITIFGTGQGFISGAPPDGTPASGPISPNNKPDVWIEPGFVDPSNVTYFGLAPGLVGVWQINFKIPDTTAPANAVQVFVRLASVASSQAPQITTIAVHQ